MVLIQHNNPNQPPQVLPALDNIIDTGGMGDCACAIVLWNPLNPAGGLAGLQFQNARGYHGGGGLGNVNWAGLLAGVPNAATTHVILLSGTLQNSNYATTSNRDYVRQQAANAGLPLAMCRCAHDSSRFTVDRNGVITRH